MSRPLESPPTHPVLARADELQRGLGDRFRDRMVHSLFDEAERIARRATDAPDGARLDLDRRIDRLVTSPTLGLPLMVVVLATVFWLTIVGANYPSSMLANLLFGLGDAGTALFQSLGAPWWLTGFLWDGVYLGLAWVIAVMLPPMAIFFPMFTFLEDLGYLPRVAFNLDWMFRRSGAHGKQALTMAMGFGCNAAGVIATRVIDSPRERLIAILTNNFVPCNGRFPTLIVLGTLFVGSTVSPAAASFAAAGSVVGVVLLGVGFTLAVSWGLSRTVLQGEASAFTLELPPWRRPRFLRIFYTSLIDRTLFVLWRAIIMAAPCGGIAWILGNVHLGDASIMAHLATALDPAGHLLGLDGVILLAYIIAIPANEIVVPTIIMAYMGVGRMTELDSLAELQTLLVDGHEWTLLTATCVMLFSLLHNPCSTTILTMWKETRSTRWTTLGALLPLGIGIVVCFLVAQTARILGG
ncbi:MAG: nucleoside recognition domain-containing protein [Gemmatimonadota bacterium]|jgi:ferrous iron transport protein B|nr:iron transporter FeoB [Gemmatimonadota bacterium]MDP6529118.1 nucleoside recognition domain-containing protein [Gemmatimonadota bacterium]MDP6802879.1 nucleoside recognition domain-containing protein [Gemmatimonadota bacterium]MDP7032175.1 nucleoside recognition domain-containing protein [Gemmatimonadota bacterium]